MTMIEPAGKIQNEQAPTFAYNIPTALARTIISSDIINIMILPMASEFDRKLYFPI